MAKLNYLLFFLFFCQKIIGQIDSIQINNLDEVIFSTNRVKNEKIIVCNLKLTLESSEIAKNNASTTADLLANMSAISLQKSQQGGGSPIIRGFEASRVLLMVDGVRMNNLIYRAGHLQNLITVDQSSLDKVEVLYGPTSSIYGSDALGGVIDLHTKSPKLNDNWATGYFRFRSPVQEKTINGSYNLGGKKWAAYGAITVSSFGNLLMGSKVNPTYGQQFGLRNQYVSVEKTSGFRDDELITNTLPLVQIGSEYQQADFLQKILYQPNKNEKHILNIQHSTSSDIPRYDRLTDADGKGGLKWAEWYYGPQQRWLTAYQFEKNETNKGFSINLNYQEVKESRHERLFRDIYLKNRFEKVNIWGGSFKKYHYFLNFNLTYGIDLQYNSLKSTANQNNLTNNDNLPLSTRYANGENYTANMAIFSANSWQISKKIILNNGLRIGYNSLYSQFLDKTFFQFPFNEVVQKNIVYSANLGMVFNPKPNLKFSVMVASGFRTPNMDDLSKVFDSAPGLLIVPNPSLKPEKTLNYELGFTGLLSNKIFFETAFFYTNFYDAIVTDSFNFNGKTSIIYNGVESKVLANQNNNKARIYGFNSSVNYNFLKNIIFNASINYTKGQIKNTNNQYNLPLDHIPPSFGKIGVKYSLSDFYMEFYLLFNGWKPINEYKLNGEDNEKYATPLGTPSWKTINGRFGYDFSKKWGIQTGFDNLFDLQYRTFASGINAPGCNFFITLKGGL